VTRFIFVLEEFLPGQGLAAAHDAGHAGVIDRHVVLDAVLAAKTQVQGAALDGSVPVTQRREAEEPLLRAYSSLPTRTSVVSRSRTSAANTEPRSGRPPALRCRSLRTRRRMRGSTRPKSRMRPNLSASRAARQSAW
jgi:hypothetical protein